jgi:hypothetical protein
MSLVAMGHNMKSQPYTLQSRTKAEKHFKLSFISNSAKRLLVLIKGVCKKVCLCKKEREIERNKQNPSERSTNC